MVKQMGQTWSADVCRSMGLDPNMVARLVIDFQRDGMVVAHVEMYCDKTTMQVLSMPGEVKIVREPKESKVNDG